MNAASKLDKQINDYLIQLNVKQKRAVLKLVKLFVEEQENEHWKDAAFIAELDRRAAECENGKVKVLTLDVLASICSDSLRIIFLVILGKRIK